MGSSLVGRFAYLLTLWFTEGLFFGFAIGFGLWVGCLIAMVGLGNLVGCSSIVLFVRFCSWYTILCGSCA